MSKKMPAPNVNLFLVLNLGSEMLYVIDQRLRAQSIALDKSAQGKYLKKISRKGHVFGYANLISITTLAPCHCVNCSPPRPDDSAVGQSIPGPVD